MSHRAAQGLSRAWLGTNWVVLRLKATAYDDDDDGDDEETTKLPMMVITKR